MSPPPKKPLDKAIAAAQRRRDRAAAKLTAEDEKLADLLIQRGELLGKDRDFVLAEGRKLAGHVTDEELATLTDHERRLVEITLFLFEKRAKEASDPGLLALIETQRRSIKAAGEHREGLKPVPRRPIMQDMLGQTDSRALKIAKTRTAKRRRPPEVQAIYDAGLTPNGAAELCGTTRDVLKQAWAKGSQFREIRPEWKKVLAKAGIPESVWRSRG